MLTWRPVDFDGIQTCVYPQDNVWKPAVALKNTVNDVKTLGDPTLNVIVHPNGTMLWKPYQVFETRCTFDITYYPFDKQSCEMIFVTWGYTSSGIRLWGLGEGAYWDDLTPNQAWTLKHVGYATFEEPMPMIKFYLMLERKPRYILMNLILPLMILISLNTCVFLLPCNSGERTSFSVTVFLAFTVFGTIVHGTLPVNSENVSYLSIFILAHVLESALITICSILLIRADRRTDEVPDWLPCLTSRLCRRAKRISVEENDDETEHETVKKQIHCIHDKNDKNHVVGRLSPTEMDWPSVIQCLDWCLFCLVAFVNVLLTLVFFLIIRMK
ncbi:neuronal acetylcholine receptor subunit alpha-6-like [Mya arenaria]|nr:neuronal acetylcholine receptor subunit alpha-6-like [Mya arenaria]